MEERTGCRPPPPPCHGGCGGVLFSTYRDPSPLQSESTIRACGEWLSSKDNVTEKRLDESKLRTFAAIDAPMSPDEYGCAWFLNKISEEDRAKARAVLLARQ